MSAEDPRRVAMSAASPYLFAIVVPRANFNINRVFRLFTAGCLACTKTNLACLMIMRHPWLCLARDASISIERNHLEVLYETQAGATTLPPTEGGVINFASQTLYQRHGLSRGEGEATPGIVPLWSG